MLKGYFTAAVRKTAKAAQALARCLKLPLNVPGAYEVFSRALHSI
jgi:hypothetical protein